MDAQATALLSTLKRPAASSESKLNLLNALKSDIKHYRVPESAQATIFECVKLAITQQASSTLASSAFSTLGHLVKRLKIQDASGHAIAQLAPRLFPALHDRLGDTREPLRSSAATALAELYPFFVSDVETMVREEAIGGSNPRAKQAGMHWVLKMHQDEHMPFKGYTQAIVARLEDADGGVRETAKLTLVELFSNASDGAKTDLKRQLKAHAVRHTTEAQILAQIGTSTSRPATSSAPTANVDLAASTRSLPSHDHVAHFAESINSQAAQPPPPETVPMDPVYIHSKAELEDTFRDMLPHFEGKETEQNWTPRDKSVLKLRRLTKGNAPSEFHGVFMAGLKSLLEGVLKVANSLRTTMSTNGCQLVQELARTLGPALDPHVEMLLQSFIKMSAATKHIASENGKTTSDAIFQNCSYKAAMMQHIWFAAQDKNAAVRQCVPQWLKTILRRQMAYKQHFESSGGLDLAEKCIRKGLDDANPKVKEGTRATYWTLAKGWPEKAHTIMSSLDPKSKTALERDTSNPNAGLHNSHTAVAASSVRETGAASRNALREMMAEQRKAKAAGRLPDRPSSAMAQLSPAKPRTATMHGNGTRAPSNLSSSSRPELRVASTASNASATPPTASTSTKKGASLMSGPVRRPRRPETARPQTADPYASRRMLRPETPANETPSASPPKDMSSKAGVPSSSAARNRAKTAGRIEGSPSGSPVCRSPLPVQLGAEFSSRPTSKGSNTQISDDLTSVPENELTMVIPKAAAVTGGRTSSGLGHKRPALGQTMSVDSGLPIMAEDDGFTMVMPSLPTHQPRAQSPLTYRSPLKAMFDEAREKVENLSPKQQQQQQQRTGSPLATDQRVMPRSNSPLKTTQGEEVQIYEDPFVTDSNDSRAEGERKVLGELPVNENTRTQSPSQSSASHDSPSSSPRNMTETRSPTNANQQDRAEVLKTRRLLNSGIERIRARTLDAHGFRRLQDIVKSPLDIWENGQKYDELMAALLKHLQTTDRSPVPTQQAPTTKPLTSKPQALALIRALLFLHKNPAQRWHAQTLVAVLSSRRVVDPNTHTATDIERVLDDITAQTSSSESCIDALIAYLLPDQNQELFHTSINPSSTALTLSTLRRLLLTTKQQPLDPSRRHRLIDLSASFLDSADAEVRKADVELASEVFDFCGDGEAKREFWMVFKDHGVEEGRLGLVSYYIARRGVRDGRD